MHANTKDVADFLGVLLFCCTGCVDLLHELFIGVALSVCHPVLERVAVDGADVPRNDRYTVTRLSWFFLLLLLFFPSLVFCVFLISLILILVVAELVFNESVFYVCLFCERQQQDRGEG